MEKYKEWMTAKGLASIRGWINEGLNLTEIAQKIGVTRETLRRWKNKYPELQKTLSCKKIRPRFSVKYQKWMSPEGLLQLQKWVEERKSQKEILQLMGISKCTLDQWRKRSPEMKAILHLKITYRDWLTPDRLYLLRSWAREGVTEKEIAARIGIKPSTLSIWIRKYPPIANALNQKIDVNDYYVENAFFRAAVGYDVTEYKEIQKQDGAMIRLKSKRHIPGNPVAQKHWLRVKKPNQWN